MARIEEMGMAWIKAFSVAAILLIVGVYAIFKTVSYFYYDTEELKLPKYIICKADTCYATNSYIKNKAKKQITFNDGKGNTIVLDEGYKIIEN